MTQDGLHKTACPTCDGHIAFPPALFGSMIDCPHCHAAISLPPLPQTIPETTGLRIAPTTPPSHGPAEISFKPAGTAEAAKTQTRIPKRLRTTGVVILTVILTSFAIYNVRYLGVLPVMVLGASIFICWLAGSKVLEPEAQPMVPAAAVHAGTLVWYLTFGVSSGKFLLIVLNLSLEAALLLWLVTRPRLVPVVALTVVHSWGIVWALTRGHSADAAGVPRETVAAIISLVVLLRVAAVILMFLGLRKIRRGTTEALA